MSKKNLLKICNNSLSENKAENILSLNVKDISSFADEIIIVTANSNRHASSLSDKLVDNFGRFDPKLELSKFQFPKLNLLKQYDSEKITIDKDELEENKNRIVETLGNYNISISNIKATIGPTVTLYEIIPDAGVRISKIKNLEDDIALSLAALGIRIIAPIPGKGTIGIEVPNKKPTVVSMHSVISAEKFQKSEMELPVAIGKTISNETLVFDLARMPHLLMAGATGQGNNTVTLGNTSVSKVYAAQDGEAVVYAGGITFSDGTTQTTASSSDGGSGGGTSSSNVTFNQVLTSGFTDSTTVLEIGNFTIRVKSIDNSNHYLEWKVNTGDISDYFAATVTMKGSRAADWNAMNVDPVVGNNSGIRAEDTFTEIVNSCLLYTSPSPRDRQKSRMPSSA